MVLTGLSKALTAQGLDVTVAATWQETTGFPVADDLRANGVKVRHIGQATGKLSRHPQLAAITDELVGGADIVHIHALWEEIQHCAARSAQRRGIPYVITPHGMLDPWNMSRGWLTKRLYLALRLRRNLNRAAALHFATDLERQAVGRLGLTAPCLVEPFGLDLREFAALPPTGTFRGHYPLLAGRPLIVFLGRIHAGKGLELLIPAMAHVLPAQSALVVVGPDGDGYRAVAEAMVKRHRLQDRVVFTGMLHGPDRIAALADADLAAQPSYHENFGISVAEALAAGTPVVVSDQVYLHTLITRAGVGGVVRTSVPELAAELSRWLGNSSLRQAAAKAARAFAFEHFDWNRIARHWMVHYRDIVERALAGPKK